MLTWEKRFFGVTSEEQGKEHSGEPCIDMTQELTSAIHKKKLLEPVECWEGCLPLKSCDLQRFEFMP